MSGSSRRCLPSTRPKYRLPWPKTTGTTSIATSSTRSQRECLAADVAGTHCHHTVVGASLGLRHGSSVVVVEEEEEERYVGLGVPTLGLGPVRHDKQMLAGGRPSLPAVGQVEQVSPLDSRPDASPKRPDVGQ